MIDWVMGLVLVMIRWLGLLLGGLVYDGGDRQLTSVVQSKYCGKIALTFLFDVACPNSTFFNVYNCKREYTE